MGTVGNGGFVEKIGGRVGRSGGFVPVAAEVGAVVEPEATVGEGVTRGVGVQLKVKDGGADKVGLAVWVADKIEEPYVMVATGVRRLACNVDIRSCWLFFAGISAISCSKIFSSNGGTSKPLPSNP